MMWIPLLFFFAISLVQGIPTSVVSLKEGYLDVLKEAISEVNEELANTHQEYFYLSPISVDVLLASFKTWNGTVGKFSTLALRGDDQLLIQKDYDGYTIYYLDLLLGLDELKFNYDFEYSVLEFKKAGQVVIFTGTDKIRAKGKIVSMNDGKCTAFLDSAHISDIGNYEVDITPRNLPTHIEAAISEFIANNVVPLTKPALNQALALFVEKVVPLTDFSKLACKPFTL